VNIIKGYLKKFKPQIICGPIFKFIETILELLTPVLMARVIDIGIKNSDKPYILKYGIIILVFNIVGFGVALVCQKCTSIASTGISRDMRKDMYEKINNFSHNEIDNFGTTSLINRITNDVAYVESLISVIMRTIARIPFLLIGALILSIIINAKLALVFCVVLPIIIVALIWFTKTTLPYFKELRVKLDTISRITRENLNGIRVIRAFNHQEEEKKRFCFANKDYVDTSLKVAKITSLLRPVIFLIVDFAIIAVLYLGGIQINIGSLSQGELIAFTNYLTTISVSLLSLSHIYMRIVNSTASMHRIEEVLTTESSVKYTETNDLQIYRYKSKPIIEFKNVGFSFDINEKDKHRMFLKDVSFKLMPNTSLGIIGPTGSGKTTLINLMLRFYDCNTGEILFYGKNIKDYSQSQLRKLMSVTQQRSNLFAGSLRENLLLRDKTASDRELIKALKTAQAWEFVENWPNRLDYKLMAGGKNVSGGQKQRLTIARSLVGKPDLLILDDSSCALA